MSDIDDDKLLALREAWLDMPFHGVVPVGFGDAIQNLVNAVSAIVDPDRTLRETEEARRRGRIADLRSTHAWAVDQVKSSAALGLPDGDWAEKRDEAAREARERFGVEL